jgi:serine/threonine-protein kinase
MLDATFLPLQQLLAGRYSIERELGRGGMGIVLLARDVPLDRLVAIKLLPPELAHDGAVRQRFLREARTAAGLSHPHIVPIHAVEELGEWVFFVMGYVDGETLRERVERSGPIGPRQALKVMQEAAWALGYAHERGVVHRDVKPDNIMIERATDRTVVMDFGIAVVGKPDETGEVIGTARYMSPEQACGEAVDGRSDLYSLGATCFYALTGRPPFEARNVPALLALHVSSPAPALRSVRAEIPDKLAAVIDRLLQKEPADRFGSGEELSTQVEAVRGRQMRSPPLIRAFMRNAQVSTMVFLAATVAGQGVTVSQGAVSFSAGGPGLIGLILFIQLVIVARRLLREGYAFADIRTALLAEAQAQQEEADAARQGRWIRRLDGLWQRVWAGKFGRWFFRVAGMGVGAPARPALPSADRTELVLGRSVEEAYGDLTSEQRDAVPGLPAVVERLEARAARLRERGESGPALTDTVAALENVRLALLRLRSGAGSVKDLTAYLDRAREIGERIDVEIAVRDEIRDGMRGG